MARRGLCAFACAAAFFVLPGCGGGGKQQQPEAGKHLRTIEDQLGLNRAGVIAREGTVERKIRDCMAAQGLEYRTFDPLARLQALTGRGKIDDADFVRRFGYGISTLFGRGNSTSDPDEEIRRRLDPSERAAYDRALWGERRGATFEEAVLFDHFGELGGCTKQATEVALGGTAVLAQLRRVLAGLEARIAGDRRMVAANARWSACMRNAGYRYSEASAIQGDILQRFRSIAGVGIRAGATLPPDPGTSYDPMALAQLQRFEVKVANADAACRQRFVTPIEAAVRPQYETAFRRQNRELLARVAR